jgi:hypothetical protein
MGGFCVLGFLLLAAAAEFGASDEKVSREEQRGEREEDKAAMGFLRCLLTSHEKFLRYREES